MNTDNMSILFVVWFEKNLKQKTPLENEGGKLIPPKGELIDSFSLKRKELFLYQDKSLSDVIVANVYFDKEKCKYLVKSEGDWKFTVDNIMEVFDCINDISKEYGVYGKCWELYDKFRQDISLDEYKKYSIYLSNYEESTQWIIDVLRREI
jgi:hypothetical protein